MSIKLKFVIFVVIVVVFFQRFLYTEEIKPDIDLVGEVQVIKSGEVKLSVGESRVINTFSPIIRAATGNPNVADVVVISQYETLINGKGPGTTTLIIWERENIRTEYNIVVLKEQVAVETRTYHLQNIWLKKYNYKVEQGRVEVTISPSASLVDEISNIISTVVEKEKFSVSAELNTIVVSAHPSVLQKIENLIKAIDIPKKQITFEAKIVEARESLLKELGLSWWMQNKKTAIGYNTDKEINLQVVSTDFAQNYLATINALEEAGKIETLASPKITVRCGEVGKILVGNRVPVISVSVDQTGNRTEKVDFVEVGVSLSILPTKISDSGDITALIVPSVGSISEWRGNYPVISTRESISEVTLTNKEALVIGGLLSSREYYTSYKVPLLSNIPVFGNLFKGRKKETEKTELIIIISPTIAK